MIKRFALLYKMLQTTQERDIQRADLKLSLNSDIGFFSFFLECKYFVLYIPSLIDYQIFAYMFLVANLSFSCQILRFLHYSLVQNLRR